MKRVTWKRDASLDRKIDLLLVIGGVLLAVATFVAGWNPREMVALAAIVLMLAANIPYCISAVQGKTQPHIITWLLLAVITGLAFFKQLQDGAELKTALPLFLAALMNVVNSAIGWRYAKKQIRKSDIVCLLVALLAIALWRTVEAPLLVVGCLTVASLAAYVPTITKAWYDPSSEPLRPYQRNTIRYLLITLAVNPYSLVTLMYPGTWVFVNGWFAAMLIRRRKNIALRTIALTMTTPERG